jgi:hypothetical protein
MPKFNSRLWRVAGSLLLGVSWGLAFVARFMGFYDASRLQKLEMFVVWGVLFGLLWYGLFGWVYQQRAAYAVRGLLLVAGCSGLALVWAGYLLNDPFVLESLPGGSPSAASSILRGLGMLAYFISLSSVVWLLLGSLRLGYRTLQAIQLRLGELMRLAFPYLAICTAVILINLVLYRPAEQRDNYQLRRLANNTLEELIRRSPDTTPQLRVYLAYQELYPGATLVASQEGMAAAGLDPAELATKGSAREVVLSAEQFVFPASDLANLPASREIQLGEHDQLFIFIQPGEPPVDQVFLIQIGQRFYFIPRADLPGGENAP